MSVRKVKVKAQTVWFSTNKHAVEARHREKHFRWQAEHIEPYRFPPTSPKCMCVLKFVCTNCLYFIMQTTVTDSFSCVFYIVEWVANKLPCSCAPAVHLKEAAVTGLAVLGQTLQLCKKDFPSSCHSQSSRCLNSVV